MDIQHCKKTFEHYGGMMRTKELEQEKIYYKNIQQLIEAGCVEKVRYGYYQWVNPDDFSEIGTVSRLFPDAILCMDTALRYYGYSDRTPGEWHLAVSKDSGKSRFKTNAKNRLRLLDYEAGSWVSCWSVSVVTLVPLTASGATACLMLGQKGAMHRRISRS